MSDRWTGRLLAHPWRGGVQAWIKARNKLYAKTPSIHATDSDPAGFYRLEVDQSDLSAYAWVRQCSGGAGPVVVLNNFTPTPRPGYRAGVPAEGEWEVALNSDAPAFGRSGSFSQETFESQDIAWSSENQSIALDIPGNSSQFLQRTQ